MNANDNEHMVTASRSCSRCGSINSTKSAIVVPSNQLNDEQEFEGQTKVSTPSLRYKRCASNLSDEEDRQHFCNSGETLSRRSSVSHLTHEVMSSFGSYTSLSFRSTTGNGEGSHKSNRHSPRPLQVDVSTPSTNTVILTPSKITIAHSSDYEGAHDKKPNVNGRTTVKRTRYISSPVQWAYAHHTDDVGASKSRADFIEIVSEPEEMCRSHTSTVKPTAGPSKGAKRVNNGIETAKKPSQYDDTNAFSIWEMAKDNNEQTIVFHHKSDLGDKCCDNYCPRMESDTELEVYADRSSCTSTINKIDDESTFKDKQNCCASMSSLAHFEQLNNTMPSTSVAGINTTNSTALANFHKNNISQTGSHRFLDLSSDIRRYSKITNFEQQNASNLLPNYLSNLNESMPAQQQPLPPGIGSQRQPANNFNSNDSYSYSNVRTENTTSNNNQLDAWADGDVQQQSLDSSLNPVQRSSSRLDANRSFNTTTNNANGSPTHQAMQRSSSVFAPTNPNHAIAADGHRHSNNNNNLPIILNNNSNNNDNIHSTTATTLRTKFRKFKNLFTKN